MRSEYTALISVCLVGAACAGCSRPLTSRHRETPLRDSAHADASGRPKLERAVNPDEAYRWRHRRWQDENGEIPRDAWRRALTQRSAAVGHWAASAFNGPAGLAPENWIERGPNNVGGRTRSLLIDPDNSVHMWAGAVSGGIWFSENGGNAWAPVDDWMNNLAICCLSMDPNNSDLMYAGTGEGFFNADAIGGTGILKSTDRGATWNQLPATASWDTVNRIAISPTNGNVLLAAKRYGGIMRSIDGGATWTNPRWAQGSFYIAFDPADGDNAVAHVIDWNGSDWFHSALYSNDAGVSWSVAAGLEEVVGFGSRIELAYAPSDPSIVYASVAAGGKIWRSSDGGQSYELRTLSGYESGVSWYANPLWVDPTDPDFLVTGGYDFYKSTNGGLTLTRISSGYIMSNQPHVDNHFVVSDPWFDGVVNRRVYVGTDGGVWRAQNIYTTSTGGGWSPRDSSYRTTQFYGAAGDGETGLIIGGTQDNGTLRVTYESSDAHLMFGGDGGFCAVDPTDPNFCYGEYVTLQIHRSTNGGVTSSYIHGGIGDAGNNANFIAPFILDPNDSDTMLAGGRSLWRSTNVKQVGAGGPSWSSIRGPGNDNVSAISVALGNSDIIWIGLNNGEVHRTANGTATNPTWVAVDANGSPNPLPNRYVERIVIDGDDNDVVYVALGGFSNNNLWKSADGGSNWISITGLGETGLPSAPINGLTRHPERSDWLYAGTEVGVFASGDGGVTWSTNNLGPANASVDELVFLHNSATLLAATHGRGLFTVDLTPPPFDHDFDGDVDLLDMAAFDACRTIPFSPLRPNCGTFDADQDGDVDIADFADFQRAFGGAQ